MWKISWSDDARKQLRKLDKIIQKEILSYFSQRIAKASHPSDFGKPLRHDKFGLWCYRLGDFRMVCQIRDGECIVLVLQVGHRKNVYIN